MEYSTIGQKLILGIEVTIIGMLIVFIVLALLSVIISFLSKVLNSVQKPRTQDFKKDETGLEEEGYEEFKTIEKTGFTSGEAVVLDVEDEEIAAIMAAVSFDSDISLSDLKIKSIKPIKE